MPGSKAPKPRSPRRRWPIAEKRRIVELTLREGVSTRAIAREEGVNPQCQRCRRSDCAVAANGSVPTGTRIWLAAGVTDMRKGFTGLTSLVQNALASNPFCGHLFVFRGRRGDLMKLLWWDGTGPCLMAKRLERGRFIWPKAQSGSVSLSAAQLSILLEGIDWRHPVRTADPLIGV